MIRSRLQRAMLALALAAAAPLAAHPPDTDPQIAPFLYADAPVYALVHARVIDGTGAAPQDDRTVLVRDGRIEAIGASGEIAVPADAHVIDMTGRSVLPGLVHLHEHLWTYAGAPLSVPVTYPRLYLSGGVTSMRTAGAYHPYADLKAKRDIDAGRAAGPWMDLTLYTGALATPPLETREDTERYLDFWLDSGFSSVKIYAYTGPEQARWIIDASHARGAKVLGHLCNTLYTDASKLGIDHLEHGFIFTPDFVPEIRDGKATGRACQMPALRSMDHVDIDSPEVDALFRTLIDNGTYVTSTLPALEDLLPRGGAAEGHDLLPDFMQAHYRRYRDSVESGAAPTLSEDALARAIALELKFLRAGGRLVVGTDSTVPSGGVIPGFSAARQLELMVEHGFTPMEVIRLSTLEGARALERDALVGSIEAGKQADLLVVDGDPLQDISDLRKVRIVFKQGVAFDPEKLRESVRGQIGIQ